MFSRIRGKVPVFFAKRSFCKNDIQLLKVESKNFITIFTFFIIDSKMSQINSLGKKRKRGDGNDACDKDEESEVKRVNKKFY